LTAAGVAIAVASAFSLLAFQHGYQQGLRRELDRLGAHILVVPKGCPYEAASLALHGANWPCYLKASYLDEVRAIEGIAAAAPVFMSAVYGRDSRSTVYLGIDTNMLALKPGWKIRGHFPREHEILAGAAAARDHKWTVGDSVELPGLPKTSAVLSGVIGASQSADDQFIYMPLHEAQLRFGHSNELTHVLVRLSDPDRMDGVVHALRGCDAGMQMNIVPLAHLFHSIQSLAASTRWFLACATLAALLAGAIGVSAALLIAVSERAREIGVMRALGASPLDVFRVIWLEALQISTVGALAGIVGSFGMVRFVENWLRKQLPFVPTGPFVTWEWWIVAGCLLLAIAMGSLAALLPARRASQLMPFDAMRRKGGYA
jgi:putative ABC transport system permease protein